MLMGRDPDSPVGGPGGADSPVGGAGAGASAIDPRDPPPPPRVVIRLDHGPRGRVGPGKVALLEQIARRGSIASAARELGMSYPRALALLVQIEATLGRPAVLRAAGGAKGGGATLTPAGRALVARYRVVEAAAQAAADGL